MLRKPRPRGWENVSVNNNYWELRNQQVCNLGHYLHWLCCVHSNMHGNPTSYITFPVCHYAFISLMHVATHFCMYVWLGLMCEAYYACVLFFTIPVCVCVHNFFHRILTGTSIHIIVWFFLRVIIIFYFCVRLCVQTSIRVTRSFLTFSRNGLDTSSFGKSEVSCCS